MLKRTLAACAILLSSHAFAESAPDCSQDKDKNIISNLFLSLENTNHSSYAHKLIDKDSVYNITLLSSTKASKNEKTYLMERRSKQNGDDKVYEPTKSQYMETNIYKQYYEINLSGEEVVIAEFYSIPHHCAVDLKSIYFISSTVEGFTPSFLDNLNTSY